MKRVYLESPFAGDVKANQDYAREAMRHSLSLGEAPFASHLLYTQAGILDDRLPDERRKGIEAGFAWAEAAELSIFYVDLGLSRGMREGVADAVACGRAIEVRGIRESTLAAKAAREIRALVEEMTKITGKAVAFT